MYTHTPLGVCVYQESRYDKRNISWRTTRKLLHKAIDTQEIKQNNSTNKSDQKILSECKVIQVSYQHFQVIYNGISSNWIIQLSGHKQVGYIQH